MAKKNSKNLVVVESPAKAKTLGKFLGDDFSIVASYGHIVDLPASSMGVDIEHDFTPTYVVLKAKQKALSGIKKEVKGKTRIYIATDPDREGEAIGWHIMNKLAEIKPKSKKLPEKKEFLRVVFHEITKSAVLDAFGHPRQMDVNLIEAQQGRRILDRVLGYQLSPLLWKKISRGLSAGRVQSVALRLIVERERAILEFKPQEYWNIEAELSKEDMNFRARLEKIDGEKADLGNKEKTGSINDEIKSQQFVVESIKQIQKKRNPYPPFITSTLQQEAFNKLGFTANKTMALAQALYEGVELPAGPQGLITYMRTDSPRAADSAIKQVREYIEKSAGKEYLPDNPNYYKAKKSAQEAHEAIRPASVLNRPQDLEEFLDEDLFKLYNLIWMRFVASQMNPALYLQTSVDIKAGRFVFRASGTKLLFAGFSVLYKTDDEDKESKILPELIKDEHIKLLALYPTQHFTKPPPRFSDATLVRLLEENGIGRPSTYAPTLQTLVYRDYVRRNSGYLRPTELGMKVIDLLVEYFGNVINVEFTAQIEENLDKIEEGKIKYAEILRDFYGPFKADLDFAHKNIKKEVVYVEEACPNCQKPLVIKWGRSGKFLSCSAFPECRFAKSITTGIKCPEPDCPGELVERRGMRGRFFYGCTNYPNCKFTSNKLPKNTDDHKSEEAEHPHG
ncbi:MAG: DNA topoisomerase I [Candidatus Omnitrophica bacterium CG11_big_fil_rev_8_21_14_0_20_42_13]|uniref:DNA topoisomerase 1 n=1 Tax=Candidatus Ghiorseimicrobium undicola TaxID=1974746 RepID=A0A2H0LXD6_9BACT|nr:MAG: DNA topoisomerase I [Candidatus Omnitrophica bacterium CG11_big_fil_rev_8_21_14_0_20_42_13]